MPKISIILTSFNHAKYLRESIDSALNQTFKDFELIIWDDASVDNSWEIIRSYSDPRIKEFRNEIQMRGIHGINKAISEVAQGEFIAIHHSDDIWELDKLEKQVRFLDANSEIGAVFSDVSIIDGFGSELTDENVYYTSIFAKKNKNRHEWLRDFFLQGNSLCHPSVLIRKEVYKNLGMYRYGLAQVGDFDMWIRICMKYEISILPEQLVKFRVQDDKGNTSAIRPETRRRIPIEYYMILDNYLKISNVDDVLGIFPECSKYIFGKQSDCQYLLARAAIDNKPFGFAVLWGLKILFEIINDIKRSNQVNEWHGFGYKDFVELTGRFDVFGYDEIARLNVELQEYT